MHMMAHFPFFRRRFVLKMLINLAVILLVLFSASFFGTPSVHATHASQNPVTVNAAVQHNVSLLLYEMAQAFHTPGDQPPRLLPAPQGANVQPDPIVQSSIPRRNVAATTG